MLLHSKTLSGTGSPEEVWLDGLKQTDGEDNSVAPPAPKFVKPRITAYKLRKLEAPVGVDDVSDKPVSALQKLLSFFTGKAA
jgi:hypothetical protein